MSSSSSSHKAQYIQVTTSDKNENVSEHKTQIELTNINTTSSSYNDNKGVNVNTKEDTSLIEDEHDNTIIDLPIEKDITLSSQTTQMKYNKSLKGNMFLCCYDKNGTPLICIGPHCM